MKIRLITLLVASLFATETYAVGPILQTSRDPYRPLYESSNQPPLNLLVLGRDHKLWYEAYNDASDLDDDGLYDVGYKGWKLKAGETAEGRGKFQIDYYGYFDSYKCYSYNTTAARFEPVAITNTKKCATVSSGRWSGDYLNYVTTSRIDAIRKVLYGGTRSTDTATDTVLQRAFIPQDAHSWGKEYDPSNEIDPAKPVSDPNRYYYRISDYTPLAQPALSASASTQKRILFANTTPCGSSCSTSYNSAPQLLYIEDSSYRVWEWLSIERPVADTEYATGANVRVTIASKNPGYPKAMDVKVQVCKSTLLEDNCKKYGTSYKPVGLIQQYGDSDSMRFGLLTGSYSHNLQGGVLRKNIGKIDDEVDQTNGTFKTPASTVGSIITTINNLRIEGFQNTREYFTSTYDTACSYANAFSQQLVDGSCSGWGNPVGEMLFESTRYLAGATGPTSGYSGDTKGAGLNLPEPNWTDPYGIVSGSTRRNNICSKPYITLLSDINPNWDGDINTVNINSISFNPGNILDAMWTKEFGGSKTVLIGENGSTNDQAPTPKSASTFKTLKGLPDEPAKKGTYMSAAIAAFARTNDINAAPESQTVNTFSVALASPLPKISMTVNGKLVTFVPFAKTPSNGGGTTGTSANYRPTDQIVDFYVDKIRNISGYTFDTNINGGRPYYKFRINYEDVEYGGDHDMDAIAEYEVALLANNTIQVTVNSTYAAGGQDQHMGYIVSGTTKDGVYLVVKDVGGANVNYWMDAKPAATGNPSGDPISPQGNMSALTDVRTFTVSSTGSTVTTLNSPLWYAAKYGGFIDNEPSTDTTNYNVLDDVSEWDSDGNGIPDNYFLVTNPLRMKEQLDKAFARIDATSRSSAPVGSTGGSASVDSEIRVYKTSYKTDKWSGNLQALKQQTSDLLNPTLVWSAADTNNLLAPANRYVFTYNPVTRRSIEFKSDTTSTALLSVAEQSALNRDKTGTIDSKMAQRIDYLRGDSTNEGSSAGKFRQRELIGTKTNFIADILDASPYAVGDSNTDYYPPDFHAYQTWAAGIFQRKNTVYAGANGGMLHAFNDDLNILPEAAAQAATDNGEEKFAYVPSYLYDKLSQLDGLSYNHEYFLNGASSVADIWDGQWKTALALSAGFGGKGVSLLDITDPSLFTAANVGNMVKWEYFNSTTPALGDPDMGYLPQSPLIVLMNDNKFRVAVSNGFNSDNGKAVLFLLDVNGPGSSGWNSSSVIKLEAAASSAGNNGLSAATGADLNGDKKIDVIYAGDLKGNIWKFDVRSSNPANWGSSVGGVNKPLFTAVSSTGVAQPIFTAPALTFQSQHTDAKDANGDGLVDANMVMVYFGTGKFVADCDISSTGCTGESLTNTFYGIWDSDVQISGRSALLKQTIGTFDSNDVTTLNARYSPVPPLTLSDVANGRCIKPLSTAGVPQACSADPNTNKIPDIDWTTQLGWYADLPLTGERHVGMPRIAKGGLVIFNTMAPSTLTNTCAFVSTSSLMALNFENGGQTMQRFTVKNSGGQAVSGFGNVGQVYTEARPNGTTTVSGSEPSGVGDMRGFGRNYRVSKTTKVVDVSPSGQPVLINTYRTVTPVSWREVIQ
ncbi:Type IV pilus biogenesis factor PilY1 [Andreprevotia sp. IGB-42]|uniref:pilus assembly protein n=1 Tax=Andreprevotia sp. IGB-42 TaxID=2497473 RepID=UPI00135A92C0|nr:PilC/PilY family type IV pilus protein [Andreprevotia sp. IGB-42]KAF0812441.1 Type IV pilus biogenesis factor PilY1 [Andreprevotia sp. IGB-42]